MQVGNAPSKFRWVVLLAAIISLLALGFGATPFGPLLPDVAKNLGIDMSMAVNLIVVSTIAAGISLLFAGIVADRYGVLVSLIISCLLNAIPATIMPLLGTNYTAILTARIIQGCCAGFAFCTMSGIIGIWFPPKEMGLAAGLMGASAGMGSLGVVAGPAVFGVTHSWQVTLAWLSIPAWIGLIFAVIAAICQPARSVGLAGRRGEAGSEYWATWGKKITWIGVLLTFCAAWFLQGFINLAPGFYAADKPLGMGLGAQTAGNLMLGAMLIGIPAPVIGGWAQDHLFNGNGKPVMIIGLIVSAIFAYLIVAPGIQLNTVLTVVCLIMAGAGIQCVYALIPAYISRTYPITLMGKMVGLWMGLGMVGGSLGVWLGGVCIKTFGNYYWAITLTAICSLVGCIFVMMLKTIKKEEARI